MADPQWRSIVARCRRFLYPRHHFQPEIIHHAVKLYIRYPVSFLGVGDQLVARGVNIFYETVRRRSMKSKLAYARELTQSRPRPGARRELDEVFISINSNQWYVRRSGY